MPLITNERTAVQILRDLSTAYPSIAQANFAREVLGAHSAQARNLAFMAERGELPPPPEADENITITREIEGRDLSITLKAGKLPITSFEELVDFYEIDLKRWEPFSQHFNFWGSEACPNFQVKASFREREYHALCAEDRQNTRDWYSKHALEAPTWSQGALVPPAGRLLEIVVSDLHADQRTTTNTTIADHLVRARYGIREAMSRASAIGFDRIALVFLGDTFNHDGLGTTTNGTPQESLGSSREAYLAIRDFIAEMTIALSVVAPVDLYVLSGNHDRERAFYAVDSLHGLLRKYERISVCLDTERAVIDWGTNLIGLWHGERQKNTDIAMSLLRENDTLGKEHLEVHLGHVHTRREDEIHGVLLRRFRTPTPETPWSDRHLYAHNLKSITGILWDQDEGEIASFPVTLPADLGDH